MDHVLSINPAPRLADAPGGAGMGRGGGDRLARLLLVFRIASILYLALVPALFATARSGPGIPRCVQQAGRNDGFYRRLKWMEAQQAAIECSGAFQGL